jgi:Na+/proline symporter
VLLIAAKDLLPAAVGALMLAAAVAIIVSTADSFLLVVSTSVVRDIYHRFLNPSASPKRLVFASRLAVIALGLIAYGVSLTSDQFLEVALWAYTVYGASITPALIATFFWKRATSLAAAASITCGTVVTITWSLLQKYDAFADSAWQNVDAVIPAITASILALVVISLLTPKPDPSTWAPFTKKRKREKGTFYFLTARRRVSSTAVPWRVRERARREEKVECPLFFFFSFS